MSEKDKDNIFSKELENLTKIIEESKKWEEEAKKREEESKKWEEESKKWVEESKKREEESKKREEESKKRVEDLKKIIEELKTQNQNKKQRRNASELMKMLSPLQAKFSDEWREVTEKIRTLYRGDKTNVVKRRAYQMSLLGIIWSEILNFPTLSRLSRTNETLNCLSESSLTIDFTNSSVWDNFSESDKTEIVDWVHQFRASPHVKPEALISSNLWGFLLRKISLCIEKSCQANHDQISKLEFFGEFNTYAIKAIGKTFFTDFVITPGCTGSLLFLAELESRGILNLIRNQSSSTLHKDLKKLAIQMAGVLLENIGMIKKYNEKAENRNKIEISSLKTFGALICDSEIEFCTSYVKVNNAGKIVILFESRPDQWSFNIFHGAGTSRLQSWNEISVYEKGASQDYSEQDVDFFSDSEDEMILPIPQSSKIDYSQPIGSLNLESIKAISNFFYIIHEYYSGLNGDLLKIYMNPDKFEKDPEFGFPEEIHKELHTASDPSPMLMQKQLFEAYQPPLTDVDSYLDSNVPTNYIFSTLPNVIHVQPTEDPDKQIVRYLQGITLPQVEQMIERQAADELESDRVYFRSVLILDIMMAIFMAAKSGIIFEEFTFDEITYRNGLYCIKTYSQARPISNEFTVFDSVESFYAFYRGIYFTDNIMMEGESKYMSLINIERIAFRRIRKLRNTAMAINEDDWVLIFKDAKAELENILDERCCLYHLDSTWFLLKNLLASIDMSRERDEAVVTRKKTFSSLSEPSSSV